MHRCRQWTWLWFCFASLDRTTTTWRRCEFDHVHRLSCGQRDPRLYTNKTQLMGNRFCLVGVMFQTSKQVPTSKGQYCTKTYHISFCCTKSLIFFFFFFDKRGVLFKYILCQTTASIITFMGHNMVVPKCSISHTKVAYTKLGQVSQFSKMHYC